MKTSMVALLLAVLPCLGAADACHPEVDWQDSQYIVGYGSLMETASKERSSPNAGLSHPVRLRGFQRSWNVQGNEVGFSTTYLGVVKAENPLTEMVAALYLDPTPEDITGTDTREKYYCRHKVEPSQIDMLDGWKLPDEAEVWIYALDPKKAVLPSDRWPIVQSYVDIFISGCMQLDELLLPEIASAMDFPTECIRTTAGWSPHWKNDRLYPRRAFMYQPNALAIDTLLSNELPDIFDKIEIE